MNKKDGNYYVKRKNERIKKCVSIMLDFFIQNAHLLNPSEQVFDALDELKDFAEGKRKKPYEVKEKWEPVD